MKIRTPYYYKEFKCIGGECIDTCCAGWEVDVDKESSLYYKSVKGEFGDRLRSKLVELPVEDQFKLREDGRCPFLNSCNLCDIYTELGEQALCDTCTNFPRHITEFGDTVEIGISLSCPVAARLIMEKSVTIFFEEEINDEKVSHYNDIDARLYFSLVRSRNILYRILGDRRIKVNERAALALSFAHDLQKNLKNENRISLVIEKYGSPSDIDALLQKLRKRYSYGAVKKKNFFNFNRTYVISKSKSAQIYSEWISLFKKLEHIKKEWPGILDEIKSFLAGDYPQFLSDIQAECENERQTESEIGQHTDIEYEHLCIYYAFRYFLRAVFDGNVYEKTGLMVVALLMQRLLDINNIHECGHCDFEDRIRLMRFYSKETEHSEENLADLFGAINHNKAFDYDILMGLLFVFC